MKQSWWMLFGKEYHKQRSDTPEHMQNIKPNNKSTRDNRHAKIKPALVFILKNGRWSVINTGSGICVSNLQYMFYGHISCFLGSV